MRYEGTSLKDGNFTLAAVIRHGDTIVDEYDEVRLVADSPRLSHMPITFISLMEDSEVNIVYHFTRKFEHLMIDLYVDGLWVNSRYCYSKNGPKSKSVADVFRAAVSKDGINFQLRQLRTTSRSDGQLRAAQLSETATLGSIELKYFSSINRAEKRGKPAPFWSVFSKFPAPTSQSCSFLLPTLAITATGPVVRPCVPPDWNYAKRKRPSQYLGSLRFYYSASDNVQTAITKEKLALSSRIIDLDQFKLASRITSTRQRGEGDTVASEEDRGDDDSGDSNTVRSSSPEVSLISQSLAQKENRLTVASIGECCEACADRKLHCDVGRPECGRRNDKNKKCRYPQTLSSSVSSQDTAVLSAASRTKSSRSVAQPRREAVHASDELSLSNPKGLASAIAGPGTGSPIVHKIPTQTWLSPLTPSNFSKMKFTAATMDLPPTTYKTVAAPIPLSTLKRSASPALEATASKRLKDLRDLAKKNVASDWPRKEKHETSKNG